MGHTFGIYRYVQIEWGAHFESTDMYRYPGAITGNNIADIFSNDDTTLHNIATTLKQLIEIRNSLLNPVEESTLHVCMYVCIYCQPLDKPNGHSQK